ncbi:hypothetical protein [Cutibacterium avidum]|uniref:hypothetical protein n=1 Tax=Cutibacterium avidum TaxID=33010 RepID=UPI0018C87618|nr:hypothetical protein [Cutibacterium avidum]
MRRTPLAVVKDTLAPAILAEILALYLAGALLVASSRALSHHDGNRGQQPGAWFRQVLANRRVAPRGRQSCPVR